MKKFIIASLLAVCSVGAFAADREEVFLAITSLEPLNGSDVADMRKYVETTSEAELKNYLVDLAYSKAVLVDNPNELDKQDLKYSFTKYDLASLAKHVQSSSLN